MVAPRHSLLMLALKSGAGLNAFLIFSVQVGSKCLPTDKLKEIIVAW